MSFVVVVAAAAAAAVVVVKIKQKPSYHSWTRQPNKRKGATQEGTRIRNSATYTFWSPIKVPN